MSRILIIEPQDDVRRVLFSLLTRLGGYVVDAVPNLEQGLIRMFTPECMPSLVLVDWGFGPGAGAEVKKLIELRNRKALPLAVGILTAGHPADAREWSLSQPSGRRASIVIGKPCTGKFVRFIGMWFSIMDQLRSG